MSPLAPWVALTIAATAALLLAEARHPPLRGPSKAAASTGFVATALAAGALESRYGRWILVALALGWTGDLLLLGRSTAPFLGGLTAFLLGHAAFVTAFLARGVSVPVTATALVVATPAALVVHRWLRPHLPDRLRLPVVAYIVVISAMAATGMGAGFAGGSATIPSGVAAFYLSDLSVARDRFVAPGFVNRLWGLPLYYAAQLLLAASVR